MVSFQSNFGTVSLQYQMSDQPQYGEWRVRVEALGQVEEATFLVEEYYQTRYEVTAIVVLVNTPNGVVYHEIGMTHLSMTEWLDLRLCSTDVIEILYTSV